MNVYVRINLWFIVLFIFSFMEIVIFGITLAKPFSANWKDHLSHNPTTEHIERFAPSSQKQYVPDIIFPDSLESREHHHSPPAIERLDSTPECARENGSDTFCEEIPSYPDEIVRDLLGKLQSRNSAFFVQDPAPEISQRIGNGDNEDDVERFVCRGVDKIIYPKVGKTKNNKWKYILNEGVNGEKVQGIRVETCHAAGKPCDLVDRESSGYVTSCKQKYAYRRMLSLSEEGQAIQETFLMPSACCCSYKRDARFLTRFGQTFKNN